MCKNFRILTLILLVTLEKLRDHPQDVKCKIIGENLDAVAKNSEYSDSYARILRWTMGLKNSIG